MRITYDPEADAVYIELRSGTGADSVDLEEGVTAALDADGRVLGLEVLDARARLGSHPLHVAVELLEPGAPAKRAKRPGAVRRVRSKSA